MTIYDIATEAGVSIATVSRVMNSPDKVSKETRIAVERVLKKYNYTPNAMARGLVLNSMKTIGILLPDMHNLNFSIAASEIENYFFNLGYTTLLCHTGRSLEKKTRYIQGLAEKKVDALILLGSVFYEPILKTMIQDYLPNIPVILSNTSFDAPNAYSFLLDQAYGMNLAFEHLKSRDYKRAYFLYANDSFNTKRKIAGFLEAATQHGFPLDEQKNLIRLEKSDEGVAALVKRFAQDTSEKTALIFYDDYNCIRCCSAFLEAGLAIPGQFGFIGCNNTPIAEITYPKLTTIDAKISATALIMCNALNDLLHDKPIGNSTIIQPGFVARAST